MKRLGVISETLIKYGRYFSKPLPWFCPGMGDWEESDEII